MKTRTIALLALLLLPTALFSVQVASDDVGSLDGTIQDDYLFAGESLTLSGEVESLFFAGKVLNLSGDATGNLISAGRTLTIDGTVGDDTFIAGRTISLSGAHGSTTFAAGETVTLFDGASIDGALFGAASELTVAGDVDGDLYAGAGTLIISGRVDGDVRAGAGKIIISDGAEITGDFAYESREELSEAELSRIAGTVTFEQSDKEKFEDFPFIWGKWVMMIVSLLSILVFALLFYLFPGISTGKTDRSHRSFWKTVAWGLIPFFGYPLVIGAFFLAGIIFGITVPIGLTLLFSLGALGYILYAFALPQIGSYIAYIFSWKLKDEAGTYKKLLVGFVVAFILGLIPFLNGIAFVIVLSLGWGVAIEKLFARSLA